MEVFKQAKVMICCIAGMHRSGTSLLASWLAQCGLTLDAGGLIAPDISNPQGYFEDLDFVRLHAAQIRRLARNSDGWRYAPEQFLCFDATAYARARELVNTRNLVYATWGWKDPRTTLFLTQWRDLIPDLKTILIWRPCAEVVASLMTRPFKQHKRHLLIEPLSAIRLWQAYNKLVYAYATRFPQETVLVSAAYLPETSDVLLSAINAQFNVGLTNAPIQDIFRGELVHSPPAWLVGLCAVMRTPLLENRLQALSVGEE